MVCISRRYCTKNSLIADALGATGLLLDCFLPLGLQETKSALAANRTAKVADRCVVGQVVLFLALLLAAL